MGHSAVILDDSRIVVFGGVGEDGVAASKLRILSQRSDGDWHWTAPDVSTSETSSPSRAWHTATLANNGIIVIAFGLDGITGDTANDVYFLKTTDTAAGWQWFHSNPLIASVTTTTENASSSVYTPNQRVLVNAAAGDSVSASSADSLAEPSMAVNAMAAGQTSLALTRPEVPLYATADSSYETQEDYSTSSKPYISSSSISRSSRTPAASATTASQDSAQAPASKGSVIAGTVTAAFVAALLAGAAALYVRKRAASQGDDKTNGDPDTTEPGVPPVSQLLCTRAAPKRMLSLGSAFSVHTSRNMHDIQSGLTFERVTGREAREAVDEFGRLSPSSDSATVLGPTAHAMTHASSADSAETQASVASYPFLTSVPRAAELSSQNSHEGNQDMNTGLNLIRSRSIGSDASDGTIMPQFARWPSSINVSDGRDEMQQARPSIDIADHTGPNPFDDFHAVSLDKHRTCTRYEG